MANLINEKKKLYEPVEKHNTAAWSNIEKTKDISKVTIPSDLQVYNAKQYADENEK